MDHPETDESGEGADASTAMLRSQPGHSGTRARASSRSLDTAVNFKGSEDNGSTAMHRSQPGRSGTRARASSRSLDTAVNFKGSIDNISTLLKRTMSQRSTASVSSFRSAPECQLPYGYNEDRPRSPSQESDSSEVFSFDPKDLCRKSDRSMARTQSSSGSDPRSPSQVTSRDSGITGSSGLTASSMSREMWLSSQYAGPDDVPCHMCRGQKLKALKSCLTCVRSFCEIHARAHYVSQELEQHQLVEVTEDLDIYKENAQLKEMINKMHEENRALREELRSLRMSSSTPSLPACICKGKTPTAADVILDPETAHRALVLSEDGKRMRLGQKRKVQPGPQRFDRWECVLAKTGFSSGRHYWQVEVNKEFTIGVMKSSAKRNGRFDFAPSAGYWCIFHFWLSFTALEVHAVRLPSDSVPRVLGVCVDVDERWLKFYNVENKDEIYTFKDMRLAPGEMIYPIFRTLEKSMELQINTVS
ncbi:uncharacterized protein LOC128607263 [Ictalurus furcatus]|uniref:uncharacterized protein LOC128607263 n=1 Tax=Ictalurus furcatus TaxID=66913 RepID=UPI0023508A42|nr:uncharacterized protein LOC128607263 [Ictalurus furcatus]